MEKDKKLLELAMDYAVATLNFNGKCDKQSCDGIPIKQFVKSGTAIGASIKGALYAQNRADYLSRMKGALKDAAETAYWLDLMKMSGAIDKAAYEDFDKLGTNLRIAIIRAIKAEKSEAKE